MQHDSSRMTAVMLTVVGEPLKRPGTKDPVDVKAYIARGFCPKSHDLPEMHRGSDGGLVGTAENAKFSKKWRIFFKW